MLYLHMCTIIYSAHIYIYICFPAKIRVSQLGSSNRVDENQPQDRTVFCVSRCICGIYNFLSENLLSPIYIYIYTHKYYVYMYIYIYIYMVMGQNLVPLVNIKMVIFI